MIPAGAQSVMASRREAPDSLEFFPTPPFATRALLRVVLPPLLGDQHINTAHDPCCGEGHMSEIIAERVDRVRASDVFDYGRGYEVADFLDWRAGAATPVGLIAMNPPFRPAMRFVERALGMSYVVAAFLRTQWLESEERYLGLLRDRPPTLYAPFVERVALRKGYWDPNGSSATAYAWFVWVQDLAPRPLFLIPPGQKRAFTTARDIERFARPEPQPLFDIETERGTV